MARVAAYRSGRREPLGWGAVAIREECKWRLQSQRTGRGREPRESAGTIAEAFRITAAERADEVAIRTKGDEFTITWGELRERVDALAGGLAQLGLQRGETLALMIGNRPEFHLCDLAGMMVGAAPFSIYSTYTAEQIALPDRKTPKRGS